MHINLTLQTCKILIDAMLIIKYFSCLNLKMLRALENAGKPPVGLCRCEDFCIYRLHLLSNQLNRKAVVNLQWVISRFSVFAVMERRWKQESSVFWHWIYQIGSVCNIWKSCSDCLYCERWPAGGWRIHCVLWVLMKNKVNFDQKDWMENKLVKTPQGAL